MWQQSQTVTHRVGIRLFNGLLARGMHEDFFLNSNSSIALGSSAIVKVSGQNCFRALKGFLRWNRHGSTNFSPRFHQGSTFCGVSGPGGRSVLGCQKVLWNLVEGSTIASPRFHRGFTKFRDLSGLLGQVSFGVPKGFAEGSPISSLDLSPSSSIPFVQFSPTALVLECSAIVKVLGQNDPFVFLGSLQQMAFASHKVLLSVPQTVPHVGLTVSCVFLWQMAVASEKGFCGGFRQLFFTFVSQKSSFEGSANCASPLSPSRLLGSKVA